MAVCLLCDRPRPAPKCVQIRPNHGSAVHRSGQQGSAASVTHSLPGQSLRSRALGRASRRSRRGSTVRGSAPKLMGGFLQACASRQAVAARSGLLEHQRSATHAAALEAPDWGIETDRRRSVVELDYRPVEAGQVPRADAVTDADAISDAGRREHVAHSIMWSSRLRASTADAIAVRWSSSSPSAIASNSERSARNTVRAGTVWWRAPRLRVRLAIDREDRHAPGRTAFVTTAGAAGRRVESAVDGD
jgi:hypothetical protein